jgi:ATP-dependent RNA helicase DHX36
VYKTKRKVGNTKDLESLISLTFSEQANMVLQDLFTRYPPDDGEVDNEMVGKKTEKIDKIRQKKDDIFCKPSMSRAEIAKKVESLASKMEKVAYLKQVFMT